MNLFKKVIATIAITTLVATSAISNVSAFNSSSADAAAKLAAQGVIVAHNDVADYELGNLVKRQEVAAVAFSIAKLTKKTTCENEYNDVSSTTPNTWACYVVEALRDNGYLAKNDNFRPEANISKAEALGMMVSAAFGDSYKYDATKGTSWQEQLVDFAVSNDVLDAAFTDYNTAATRGQTFQWTVNAIDAAVDSDDLGLGDLLDLGDDDDTTTTTTGDDTTGNDTTGDDTTVSTTSELTVELNPESPAGADLPKNADGVLVLKLDVTAGNEDTSVTGFDFERTGFSEDAANKIILSTDSSRLTKAKTFNSDDEASVSVSPALVVKAGETVTVNVRIDTAATTGEFAIKLTGVTASSTVVANELTSNVFDVKGQDATQLEVKDGSVNSQVTAGELAAEVAEFDLENKGNVSNSDVTVTSITLKEVGTIDQGSELANFSLVSDGQVIATVDAMAGKYVTFNLSTPVVIEDGKKESFTVTADITGGADDTIKFIVDTAGDVVASASKYNSVDVVVSAAGNEVTVQAGELTIYAIDATNDKVRDDKNDIVIGQLKIVNVAGESLNIKNLGVDLTTTNSGVAEVLENVKAEINGTSYDLYAPSATATTAMDVTYSDTDLDIVLPQGTTVVTIIADTLDNLTDGTEVSMKLAVDSTHLSVEDADDTAVTDVTPSSLSWDELEIKQPKATVSKTPLANVSIVKGTSDLVALQFEVEANETSALSIDEVKVKVSYTGGYGAAVKDYVSEVKLFKGSVSDANKLDSLSGNKIGTDGVAKFDGFTVNVAADATETFIVVVSTVDSDAVIDAVITVETAAAPFINVEDDENDTVTVENNVTAPFKTITLKDSGSLTLTADANNVDNEDPKTILAGEETVVYSADVIANNEEVTAETVKFTIDKDIKNAVSMAKLYLDGNLVATTSTSKINVAGGVTTIKFDDITGLYFPTTSSELSLGLVTETMGHELVGQAVSDAKVTSVIIEDAKGSESNEDVTVTPLTTTGSEVFAVVPAKVIVAKTKDMADGTAKFSLTVQTGDNRDSASNAAPVVTFKTVTINNKATGGAIKIFEEGESTEISNPANIVVSETKVFEIVPQVTTEGNTYTLSIPNDGISYEVNGQTYTINRDSELDLGSKSY